MQDVKEFEKEMLFLLPDMFRYALSMTRNRSEAEDLVQDTLMKAMELKDGFEAGTNMKGWLFKIELHILKNNRRKIARQKILARENIADPEKEIVMPSQMDKVMLVDFCEAMERLPIDQKAAIYLVVVEGHSYEDAAKVLECSVGTVKSRVSRGRQELARHIEPDYVRTSEHGMAG